MKAACIHPDIQGRMRFKQIGSLISSISSIQTTGSLLEVQEKLSLGQRIEAIFISDRFEDEVTHEFVQLAKKTDGGKDSAYMLVFSDNKLNESDVARLTLNGLDSFLFEPYSADGLSQCIDMAQKLNAKRADERQRAGIEVLIQSAIKNIDECWLQLKKGEKVGLARKQLEGINAVLTELTPECLGVYYTQLTDKLEELPPPVYQEQKKYTGVSARIRRKLG